MAKTSLPSSLPSAEIESLELAKLKLEQARYRADVLKWIVVAVGAVISFAVIDYGKLRLEQFKATAENQRELLNAYLRATESPEPDVWKRKLQLIKTVTEDRPTVEWVDKELKYINEYAALDALYRETLKVVSQLVEPSRLAEPERVQARARYNQLYWADLPFAGESQDVITAMIKFRNQLLIAEESGADLNRREEWILLNSKLLDLSNALRESAPSTVVPVPVGSGV